MITARIRIARAARCVVAVTATLLMFTPAAQAGFLDFLFGQQAAQTSQSAAPQAPAGDYNSGYVRPRLGRPVSGPRRSNGASAAHRVIALCCKDGGDPMAALMSDPTLRDGDAVMTPQGMAIFEGAVATRFHHPEDFVAIGKATGLPLKNRARVAAVSENIHSFPNNTNNTAPLVRPAAGVDLTAQQIADR
jgi:hypothetical protein